jgi:hypothetical protein
MKLFPILAILALIFTHKVAAQIDSTTYTYVTPIKSPEFSDSLLALDGFIIRKHHEINNAIKLDNGSTGAIEKLYCRIKINALSAIEPSSIVSFPAQKGRIIKQINARTIKTDGTIKNFLMKDIVQLPSQELHDPFLPVFDSFKIPQIEVGDEVEYLFILEYPQALESGIISMYNFFPSMSTTFCFKSPPGKKVAFRSSSIIDSTVGKVWTEYLLYKLKNCPGIGDTYAANVSAISPILQFNTTYQFTEYYAAPYDHNYRSTFYINDWIAVRETFIHDEIKNVRKLQPYKHQSFVGYMMRWNESHRNYTDDQKIFWLQNFINDSLLLVELQGEESNSSLMYYILNKKIDTKNIHNLIQQFLLQAGISYNICFGRNRYEGPVNFLGPTRAMVTDIYYVAQSNAGEWHYIFPPTNQRRYYVDEIPVYLGATISVWKPDNILHEEKPFANSMFGLIPSNPVSTNVRTFSNFVQVDLNSATWAIQQKEKLQGDFSTLLRSKDDAILKTRFAKSYPKVVYDSLQIKVDKNVFPFEHVSQGGGQIKSLIQNSSDDQYSISLSDIRAHYIIHTSGAERQLNFLLPFKYTDIQKVYLQFTEPIEVLNGESLNFTSENEFATYTLSLKKISETVILLESLVEIRKQILEPEQAKLFHQLNQQIKSTQNLNITIKRQ